MRWSAEWLIQVKKRLQAVFKYMESCLNLKENFWEENSLRRSLDGLA